MTNIQGIPVTKRIGVGKGTFTIRGDFDADSEEIADMLNGVSPPDETSQCDTPLSLIQRFCGHPFHSDCVNPP